MDWGGYRLGFLFYLLVAGFLAEMAGGALGVGYGVFSTTLLIAGGLLPAVASASVHTAETLATLISAISHHQFGNVDKRLAAVLSVPGVLGAVAGALLLSRLPGEGVRPWIAGLLLFMGIVILVRFISNKDRVVPISAPFPVMGDPEGLAVVAPAVRENAGLSMWQLILLALVGGTLDSFGGGGWGPVTTPVLLMEHNIPSYRVVGSVTLASFFVTLASTLAFSFSLGLEQFQWPVVVFLLVGSAISAPIAAWVCRKIPPKWLGVIVGLLLILTNLRSIVLYMLAHG
ncbi:MAG: sulfite exporter TauE/SafE family protein [Anaerolineae bacterium]